MIQIFASFEARAYLETRSACPTENEPECIDWDLLTAATKVLNEPLSTQGMPRLVKTLQLYPDYFEHQGWREFTVK